MRVTRKYRFAASHRLHAPQLSAEQNRALYGKCNNPFGHGHNYEVSITVRGAVDARTGRTVDPALLDRLVKAEVVGAFDHRNLNLEVEAFQSAVPTSENLGLEIARRLKQNWNSVFPAGGPCLDAVLVAETGRNSFEVPSH